METPQHIPIEEIRRCRRALVERGYRDHTWVKPVELITDVAMKSVTLAEFQELWQDDYADDLERYKQLMRAKVKPRLNSPRFHDPGKPYREELQRIEDLQRKGLISHDEIQEVHVLRRKLKWAWRCAVVEGEQPPQAALDSPAGFIIGDPHLRCDATYQTWCIAQRGSMFPDDFCLWLETIHG